jgi:hypothetical protein
MLHHPRPDRLFTRLWARLRQPLRFRQQKVAHLTDLRELTPYMRWDIGITDIGPTERRWR